MRFRLIYDGPLQSKQRDAIGGQRDPSAQHTHAIRRVFHKQLRHLWHSNRFLSEARDYRQGYGGKEPIPTPNVLTMRAGSGPRNMELIRDIVPDMYHEYGYRFLPLVREDWELLCDLEILFLRRDIPGSVINAGDLDNRIKTLIDALRRPRNAQELAGNDSPGEGEDPFYVLMEDDKQVTSLAVETDALLEPPPDADDRHVRLVVTVTIRPYYTTKFNLSFG